MVRLGDRATWYATADDRLAYPPAWTVQAVQTHDVQVIFTSHFKQRVQTVMCCLYCTALRPRSFPILLYENRCTHGTLQLTRHIKPHLFARMQVVAKRNAYRALCSTAPHVPVRYGTVQYSIISVRTCTDSYPYRTTNRDRNYLLRPYFVRSNLLSCVNVVRFGRLGTAGFSTSCIYMEGTYHVTTTT